MVLRNSEILRDAQFFVTSEEQVLVRLQILTQGFEILYFIGFLFHFDTREGTKQQSWR
jgi:hypothetical protein